MTSFIPSSIELWAILRPAKAVQSVCLEVQKLCFEWFRKDHFFVAVFNQHFEGPFPEWSLTSKGSVKTRSSKATHGYSGIPTICAVLTGSGPVARRASGTLSWHTWKRRRSRHPTPSCCRPDKQKSGRNWNRPGEFYMFCTDLHRIWRALRLYTSNSARLTPCQRTDRPLVARCNPHLWFLWSSDPRWSSPLAFSCMSFNFPGTNQTLSGALP